MLRVDRSSVDQLRGGAAGGLEAVAQFLRFAPAPRLTPSGIATDNPDIGRATRACSACQLRAARTSRSPPRAIPKRPPKLLKTASIIAECRPGTQSCKTSIDPANSVRTRAITIRDALDRNPSAKANAVEQ